jgi:D-sedoheptulose 7-phosphate isomerase
MFNFAFYFKRVDELLMDKQVIDSCSQVFTILSMAILSGNSIYVCGNGGSAATADHFVNDLLSIRVKDEKVDGVKAYSLCSNCAVLTCLANDIGYDFIFSKQLESFLKEGDVVVGISASGNSSNIINSMLMAQQKGAIGVGITGFDGGIVKQKTQYNICLPSVVGEYGPVEDAHSVICHALSVSLKGVLEGREGWVFAHD